MEQRDAILLLAKELAERDYVHFISDEKTREELMKGKTAIIPIKEPLSSTATADLFYRIHYSSGNCEPCKKELEKPNWGFNNIAHWFLEIKLVDKSNLHDLGCNGKPTGKNIMRIETRAFALEEILKQGKNIHANYLFGMVDEMFREKEHDQHNIDAYMFKVSVSASPYAIISSPEEKILRETFYKNIPQDVKRAMSALNIEDFQGIYELYSQKPEEFLKKTNDFEIGDFCKNKNENKEGMIDGVEGRGILRIISNSLFYHYNSEDLNVLEKSPHTEHFMNFVFSLPEEEQNEEANKGILNFEFFDATQVLLKMYEGSPERFMGYFPVSSEQNRISLVNRINLLSKEKQNSELNAFLFKHGYNVYVEFLDLYKNDAGSFQKYFTNAEDKEKKEMLSAVYSLPSSNINPEISRWLSENYAELVEEVGIKSIGNGIAS